MAPPTGPRGGAAQRSAPRTTRGGGISKRRTAIRTDRDGDVSMDVPATRSQTGKPPTGPSGRGGRSARGGRSTQASSRLAQNLKNHLGDAKGRGSKPQYNKTTLKILGLKSSKAANNPDGGLRSLLDFLERKSSKGGPITLGRVRFPRLVRPNKCILTCLRALSKAITFISRSTRMTHLAFCNSTVTHMPVHS